MDKLRLAHLVVSAMVSGGVTTLDIRDGRDAHAALMHISRSKDFLTSASALGVDIVGVPDPAVGMRVLGFTQAMWEAVAQSWLAAEYSDSIAILRVTEVARRKIVGDLAHYDETTVNLVRQAGEFWATSSTARNSCVSPTKSPARV